MDKNPNLNLICNLIWQNNVPNIKWVSVSRERERKKVRKTNKSWFFSKSKGHNFVKNQWIRTKFKINLYLGMSKQCTKYFFLFITILFTNLWKGLGSRLKAYLSPLPNIKWIWEKNCVKLIIRDFYPKSKGHNFAKNQWIETKLKLDLYLGMTKPYTKYQMNICKQSEKKSAKQ
jgi:hypothetical protein